MSKISSYSLADEPLQLSDRLIGTEAPRPTPSATPLATKNFSLGELLQLFSSEFPAASLQAVLDTGNTATQNITLTGTITTSVIKPDEIEDVLGSQGSTFQFLSKAVGGINWVDLPIVYPTLDEVLDAGNISSLTPKVGGISLFDGIGYVNIEGNSDQFYFSNRSNFTFAQIYQDNILLKDLNGYSFKIQKPFDISNNHTAFLQDTSGTIAYLGDIPTPISLTTIGDSGPATLIGDILNIPNYSGGTVPTLDEVLNEGNYSELDADIGKLGLYDTSNGDYSKIYCTDRNFNFNDFENNGIFSVQAGLFVLHKSNSISAFFDIDGLTISRSFNLPDANGTIALTSDISIPTLDEVLTEGNISTKDAAIGGLSLYDASNSYYYSIYADDDMFGFINNDGNFVALLGLAEFTLYKTSSIAANFSAALLTSTRNFELPNASGTIALTSNIPSLTGYVPYTGATTNLNLGEYEVKAGQMTLDITPTGVAAVGTTQWNNTIGSSQTLLKGGSVLLKNGVDLVARVVNKVTPNATLLRSNYQAVRISGAQGQRLAVAYAQANNDNNSADTIGLVCENISTNQEGFIITVGQLEEINTTGSLQGESWSDGDVLYLSPTTPGSLTNIKPTGATGHIVVIGYVEYAHAIHGKIYVKIMNGWELDELHNVYITSPTNNELLAYNSSSQLWENKTLSEVNAQQFFMNLPYRYINTDQSVGSNASGETQLIRVTIPANTFSSADKFYFRLGFSKVGTANSATIRAKITTASSMPAGATSQIAVAGINATVLYAPVERNMGINGGNLKGFGFTSSNISDSGTSAVAWSSVAFDVTQTQYFYVSITPAATTTDVTYLEFIEITNI
jgi:nitrogen fixation protein